MPNFFINVKEKGAKKAAGSIKSLTGSMKMMALQAVSVTAVVQGLRKSISMSAEMEGVKKGFDNLAKSSGFSKKAFDNFKKATDGTVNSLELMKQANNAMLLGITDSEEQMANMFDVAQRLGQSLGLDTVQAVESLTTGLGRQSKLMLDNLGIMIDTNKAYEDYADSIGKTTSELTDQERKTAFVNAAMAEANSLVSKLGEEQLTTKDAMAQANEAASAVAITIGDMLSPSIVRAAEFFVGAAEAVDEYLFSIRALDAGLIEDESNQDKLAAAIAVTEKRIQNLNDEIDRNTNMFQRQLGASSEQREEMGELEATLMLLNKQYSETNMLMVEGQDPYNMLLSTFDSLRLVADEYGISLTKVKEPLTDIAQAQADAAFEQKILNELQEESVKKTKGQLDAFSKLAGSLGKLNEASRGSALVTARLQQAAIIASAASGAMAAISPPTGAPTPAGWMNFAAVIAAGTAQAVSISQSMGDFKKAATGMNEVVTKPTMILAGEAGAESVQITPLNSDMNVNGVQGGGANITLNISAPLVDDTVVDTIIPAINEAIRRGETLTIA
tara:strand:+ start:1945 stop:3621 length:1677 start_codon:yes stop_codon:yes gene_type:complete